MAVVLTEISPEIQVFPWAGFPPVGSPIQPRGEVRFCTREAAVTDGGTDGQIISILNVCPVNFAYALVECFAQVKREGDAVNGFESVGTCTYRDGFCDVRFELVSEGLGTAADTIEESRTYVPRAIMPQQLTYPTPDFGGGVQVRGRFFNANASEDDYFVTWYLRLLQYDLQQAYEVNVNTPRLVR